MDNKRQESLYRYRDYAFKKDLGMRNSSNKGEKINLIVSKRKEYDGMNQPECGSVVPAYLTTLKRNGEYAKWFREGEIDFKLAA